VMHQVESKREEQALAYDQEVDEAAGLSEAWMPWALYALDMDKSPCTFSYTSCVLCILDITSAYQWKQVI
jgi:hypothetical protein